MATGSGTKDDPWRLTTAPGSSEYTMHRDDEADPPLLVCQVGSTKLTYLARAIDDPVGGWYGQRKGYRGRFGMYLPPLLEALGKAELTHEARNNRVRAT
jgi:hypothetical protein